MPDRVNPRNMRPRRAGDRLMGHAMRKLSYGSLADGFVETDFPLAGGGMSRCRTTSVRTGAMAWVLCTNVAVILSSRDWSRIADRQCRKPTCSSSASLWLAVPSPPCPTSWLAALYHLGWQGRDHAVGRT